ncbi:MAG: Asp-tRNA(Asn)/Glu-tRNA(Gln) amidotransferase subunit GatA [Candidatus Nanopelagicales bacterium]
MSEDLTTFSAQQLAAKIKNKDVTASEVTQAHFDRIEKLDKKIESFLYLDKAAALEQAKRVDKKVAKNETLSPLAGVPLALKDVMTQRGVPTTCGSKILENWRPPYDSTVVKRLKENDVIILGKVNMDEFAMGSSTENSAYQKTKNPWDLSRIPGGSSGGSSAAVASFFAPLAIGTDTGGSIRQPAAVCGIVGTKPTYGTVSRYGLIAFASSLDQAGPITRSVMDAALLNEVIAGYDPLDSTSINQSTASLVAAANTKDLKGMKIGVIKELGGEGWQEGVVTNFNQSIEILKQLGAEVVEISLPHSPYALAVYYLIAPSEASSNLARFDGMRYGLRVGDNGEKDVEAVMNLTRAQGFGPEVKRRIILGTYALSTGYYDAYYGQAQKVRGLIAEDFKAAFEKVDVLVSPTSPTTAWKLGERVDNPLAMYLADLATLPPSLAGVPAISVPIGLAKEDQMPVGLQIIAPAMQDHKNYQVASAIEAAQGGLLIDQIKDLASLV